MLLTPTGGVERSASVGSDPVAVIVSDDGSVAYVADSSPGDVYAVRLPSLAIAWKQHVGGAPFGLLLHAGRLYVTLYDGAAVDELNPPDGRVLASNPTAQHPAAITVNSTGSVVEAGGAGFGIALVANTLWTADYQGSALLPGGEGRRVPLPLPLHPFWLAPGAGSTLLIAAEGQQEDSDPGAVYAYDVAGGAFRLLDQPLDPDQAVQWGPAIVVAAHGSRRVDVIDGGHVAAWAKGAAAVAVAPDSALNLLVVAVNAHE